MGLVERKQIITYRWESDELEKIPPEHHEQLDTDADNIINEQRRKGFTSGSLETSILPSSGKDEEVYYRGWWEITTKTIRSTGMEKHKRQKGIRDLNDEVERMLLNFKDKIKGLPDNDRIKRVSEKSFTISSKEIFNDLTMRLDPAYYDFKKQYEEVVRLIYKYDSLNKVIRLLESIIETGKLPKGNNLNNNEFVLHTEVVAYIKEVYDNA